MDIGPLSSLLYLPTKAEIVWTLRFVSLYSKPTVSPYYVSSPGNQHSSNPRETACGFGATFYCGHSKKSFTY